MENIEFLLSFFGWCSVINIAVLVFATVFLALFGDFAKNIHSKIFNIPKDKLDVIYFKYLAYYKLAIFIFNLVPYLTLLLMKS